MTSFKDLEFKPHPLMDGKQAIHMFPNGYGVSVVRFRAPFGSYGSYTSNEREWEVAIIKHTSDGGWTLTYDTPITDDVIGHVRSAEVTRIMRMVEKLKKKRTRSKTKTKKRPRK